jgi:HAD superfamily hydrolase (TIGR01509 family)
MTSRTLPEVVEMPNRGVLFDVDGTLVDTAYVHTICWAEAFAEADLHPPMARVHRAIGMGAERLVGHVLGTELDPAARDGIVATQSRLHAEWHGRVTALPGAHALLERCAASGLAVVLASSSNERDLEAMRRVLDADAWVTAATSSGDADEAKPSPDILAVALERAGLAPDDAVAVGDAVWDAEAAAALGVTFIGVESGGNSAHELRKAGAVAVARDPLDLLERFDETPLGELAARAAEVS